MKRQRKKETGLSPADCPESPVLSGTGINSHIKHWVPGPEHCSAAAERSCRTTERRTTGTVHSRSAPERSKSAAGRSKSDAVHSRCCSSNGSSSSGGSSCAACSTSACSISADNTTTGHSHRHRSNRLHPHCSRQCRDRRRPRLLLKTAYESLRFLLSELKMWHNANFDVLLVSDSRETGNLERPSRFRNLFANRPISIESGNQLNDSGTKN